MQLTRGGFRLAVGQMKYANEMDVGKVQLWCIWFCCLDLITAMCLLSFTFVQYDPTDFQHMYMHILFTVDLDFKKSFDSVLTHSSID